MRRRAALLLGQWFGCGLSPVAPGTVGSAGALPLFFLLQSQSPGVYWGTTAGLTGLGIWSSEVCAGYLGDHDPSSVVIDEVAGVLIALGCVRTEGWPLLALAWLLFRLLDVAKPWLIDRAQSLRPAGLGIMADDVLSGAGAGLGAWLVHAAGWLD